MNLICPFCQHDHLEEVENEPDAWVSYEGPYETECAGCEEPFIVHTHIAYTFETFKKRGTA